MGTLIGRFFKRGMRWPRWLLLILAAILIALYGLGEVLDVEQLADLLALGIGIGMIVGWLAWTSSGSGAPVFNRLRIVNNTDKDVTATSTIRSDPEYPSPPPPPEPATIGPVPPESSDQVIAPPGTHFFSDVQGVQTEITIDGTTVLSLHHVIDEDEYPDDRAVVQVLVVDISAEPGKYDVASILAHRDSELPPNTHVSTITETLS